MNQILTVNDFADLGTSYYVPFRNFGTRTSNVELLFDDKLQKDIVLVVFTGGADVSPELYCEEKNPKTGCWPARDKKEKRIFDRAVELGKNIAGICRGSQFVCAMSGGKLVQHITGHGSSHNVRTDDGRLIRVSSTHHQMQLPPADALSIAWAEPRLSSCYEGPLGVEYEPEKEYDVVWYPSTNSLGMQYHPEFMPPESEGFRYCAELIERFFHLPQVVAA